MTSLAAPCLCALCDTVLGPGNTSNEHIILQAIGGRLKTPDFICKPCNDTTGYSWDVALANELHHLCVFFNVDRENGPAPQFKVQTSTGEQYYLRPGEAPRSIKPTISTVPTDAGIQLSIQARDMGEARRHLNGLKRKYPKLDVEGILATAQTTREYPKGAMKMTLGVGGPKSGRSIVKAAVAFAHWCGIPADKCSAAIAYLKGDDQDPPYGFYYEADLIEGRPKGTPLHCVAIVGDSATRLLLGYVEYFGIHRQVVCLSDEYDGPDIVESHAIDPRSATPLNVSVALPFNAADLRDIFDYKRIPDGGYADAVKLVLPPELQRHADAERERAISDASEYAFKNCGAKPGDLITPELAKTISSLFVQRLAPYIEHLVMRPVPPPDFGRSAE